MRKRWIIAGILLAGLAAAYTGYWFWLARTFERNLALWIDQQRALGYRISYAAGEASGYPLAVKIALSDVSADAPPGSEAWRFSVSSVLLGLAPWRPVALNIQDSKATTGYRLQWNANGRNFELVGSGIEATIGLSGQTATPAIAFGAEHLELRDGDQSIANTYRLSGEIAPTNTAASPDGSIEFNFDAHQLNLVIDSQSRKENKEVYSPSLKGRIVGTIPIGSLHGALAEWSKQGGYLDITNVTANPAGGFPPRFQGSASIALDPQLQPIVAGSVTVYDYIPAIDRAIADGDMTPAQGTATKVWLGARSENDGGSIKATLPITIQDGFVSMGPIKLARVPRIEWQ